MMKIPKPPKQQDLGKIPFDEITHYLPTFKATSEDGRYFSWEEFRHRYPQDTERKWLATKINRAVLWKNLSLKNFEFKYGVPESLQAILHFIDKTTAGYIGTDSSAGFGRAEQTQFLLKSLIMEEAISSAQLEGAVTTRKVAKEMLMNERKPRTQDEVMILNNYRLMQKSLELSKETLSVDIILKLHKIATYNAIENQAVAGEFRQTDEIFIGDYDGNNIYQPPPHQDLPHLMADFCEFVNTNHSDDSANFIHPIVKAMIIHFLIGFIHPFGDGNGRTARALFYWFVLKNRYWLFEYLSISRLLKKAPKQYAMAYINTEVDELDMTYFLYYQAGIIKRAITALEDYINNKKNLFNQFTREIHKWNAHSTKKLNARQIQILQKAIEQSGDIFTLKAVCNKFGVTENTARKDLKTLADLGLLLAFKQGNATNYISPKDLLERLKEMG